MTCLLRARAYNDLVIDPFYDDVSLFAHSEVNSNTHIHTYILHMHTHLPKTYIYIYILT